jgi:signal transduction histidine kinase
MTWRESGPGPAWFDGPWPERRVSRRARLWFPVVFSLVVQVAGTAVVCRLTALPPGPTALAVFVAAAGALALLAARRFPGPTAAVVAAAAVADVLLRPDIGPPPVSLAFAVVFGIVRGARVWVVSSIVVAWAAALVGASVIGVAWSPARIVISTLALLVLVVIGVTAAERRERAASFRRVALERRQSAEQGERVRIARELHDVLAHSLSQISVQAGVGLHLMDSDPEQARAALAAIKRASKGALDEVREVLGVLRSDEAAPTTPVHGLDDLAQLVDGAVSSGVAVSLDVSNEARERVSATIGAAVYRIVQEALTNVLRHAGARSASVTVSVAPEGAVVVEVGDDGRGAERIEPGNGVLGMRERATLSGGELTIDRGPLGGVLVRARLPLGSAA